MAIDTAKPGYVAIQKGSETNSNIRQPAEHKPTHDKIN
jgi:hypothetical protein